MKKGKKILIAVLAVAVVAAIVVCGLVLGGVINFGEDRTAKAGELVEDDFLSTTYRSQEAAYSFTLKSIYGITDTEVNDFFADQSNSWKAYTQQVRIENKGDTTLVVLGSAVENNGTGNVWVRILPDSAELNIAPGGTVSRIPLSSTSPRAAPASSTLRFSPRVTATLTPLQTP